MVVLNVNIISFFLVRQTGHKKKLNTYIGFSEILDMEPYVEHKGNIFTKQW